MQLTKLLKTAFTRLLRPGTAPPWGHQRSAWQGRTRGVGEGRLLARGGRGASVASRCMTFRHRHFRLSRLIELAEVEEGKAEAGESKTEACEEEKREIREQSGPGHRLLLVPRHLCLARDKGLPTLARVPGKQLRRRRIEETLKLLPPRETAVGFSWTHGRKHVAGQLTLPAGCTAHTRPGPSLARPDL
jgi:hypothetical protein